MFRTSQTLRRRFDWRSLVRRRRRQPRRMRREPGDPAWVLIMERVAERAAKHRPHRIYLGDFPWGRMDARSSTLLLACMREEAARTAAVAGQLSQLPAGGDRMIENQATDFDVTHMGQSGISTLRPLSDAGRAWRAENIPKNEDRPWMGDGIVIEDFSYLLPILRGIIDADLTCSVGGLPAEPVWEDDELVGLKPL